MLPIRRGGARPRPLTLIFALEAPGLSLRGFLFHRSTFTAPLLILHAAYFNASSGVGLVLVVRVVALVPAAAVG